MKNIYFIIVLFTLPQVLQSQTVNIPDTNFKNALINTLCVDTSGDGVYDSDADTNDDNEIQVREAEAILRLKVSSQGIVSLEGVGSFINLVDLYCDFNELVTLDISLNTKLEILNCLVNNLTSLDISKNESLSTLYCGFNQLTTLDISNNPSLLNLWCYTNQLTSLNLKNGNNALLISMLAQDNSNLTCIEVDDVELTSNAIAWSKDANASYKLSCEVLGNATFENETQIICSPNPVKDILRVKTLNTLKIQTIKVYNLLGKIVMEEQTYFKELDLSNLNQGIFLIIIETDKNIFAKRIVKN